MIVIGRISRCVGIRGEVKIVPLTDDPERFAGLETVWVGPDESRAEQCTIATVRTTRSGVVLKMREIGSRLAAEMRRGSYVYVADANALKPPPGSYFIHDIIGMEVSTDQGELVGVVKDVLKLPANDVWVVVRGKTEILLPATKNVIVSVDVRRRVVVIHPMEGLLES
jgi:16S rRNA processing protein RimM